MKTSRKVVITDCCSTREYLTTWLGCDWWCHAHSFLEERCEVLAGHNLAARCDLIVA